MLSVLLVEPHDDTRELYREWLQLAGMRVYDVATTHDAMPLVAVSDVVVMESQLPGQPDAFAFISEVRTRPETHDTPIVVVSASGPLAEDRARRAGCDLFLAKPCLPEQLHLELFLISKRGSPGRMAHVPGARSIRDLLRRLG